jgi:nucleoside-diphosphate-sugar epimerase
MKVLYIGGTGRISHACVRASAEASQEVWVFNRGRTSKPLPAGVRRIVGDLEDDDAYRRLGEQTYDVVCQFKAYDRARAERDREVFAGRCGQYVFISSASAYRKPPARWRITEDVPLANPYWPYSQAKADIEALLRAWHHAGTLPVTIVRPSHTNDGNLPGTFMPGDEIAWRMIHGRPVIAHGDGTSLWVMTHAEDFAVPFVRLLGNAQALGEAFHITSDEVRTWDEILRAMAAALDARAEIVHVPTDTLVRYNADWTGPLLGDKTWPVMFDNSKVKSVAGAFACRWSMAASLKPAAGAFRQRLATFRPDPALHALVDRIVAGQSRLGRP